MIVRIDRFGNIVTNVHSQDKTEYSLEIEGKEYHMGYYPTYWEAPAGGAISDRRFEQHA
jgi:S-adenosylmethionine hydrolase